MLLRDGTVEGLEDDRYEVVAFGAFDLLEGLDIVMLGAVHDAEDFGDEFVFFPRPLASRTHVSLLHKPPCFTFRSRTYLSARSIRALIRGFS
jgi:hypothetical protein